MANMGKKAIQKQAVAYSMETGEEMARMDISNFRLYIHYKYMDKGIDKQRMLFQQEDEAKATLEEIFKHVAQNSEKHDLTKEEVAVAVAVASYYTAEGVGLNPKHTLQEAEVKNGDTIDIVVNAMDEMEEPATKTLVKEAKHSMMAPTGTFFFNNH